MKKILFSIAGAALLFASCREQVSVEPLSLPADSGVIVNVQGVNLLKGNAEVQTDAEKNVTSLDIVIYDESGTYEAGKSFTDNPASKIGVDQVITGLTEGPKTICVAVNAALETYPGTIGAFYTAVSNLADNSVDNGFVMTGSVPTAAAATPTRVVVPVKRIAAKFVVDGNITVDLIEEDVKDFTVSKIYIANAATASNFAFGAGTYKVANPAYVNIIDKPTEFVKVDALRKFTVCEDPEWTSGKPYAGASFYVYPNVLTEQKDLSDYYKLTTVVIEASYKDAAGQSQLCYYPIRLAQSIDANTVYRIGDIKITCIGVDNPIKDFNKIFVSFNVSVEDWTTYEVYNTYEF